MQSIIYNCLNVYERFVKQNNYELLHDKFATNSPSCPSFVNVDTRIIKYYKFKTDIDHSILEINRR